MSEPQPSASYGKRALAVLGKAWWSTSQSSRPKACFPTTSVQRQQQSASDTPIDVAKILAEGPSSDRKKDSVLYLAYGSNLSAETFKGTRGIQPLSQVNVLVPSLDLTFDLPGIPYIEPCFANTRLRDAPEEQAEFYHKDRWHKGLVGVVYEVTFEDYATIIATEGGGSSYQDITVDCFEIPAGTKNVDPNPIHTPFKAHTLFSPQQPAGNGRASRPDPSYAQASARYLKLITDGAEEHALPGDYREYLHSLRPYTITTKRQTVGKILFLGIWLPFVLSVFQLGRLFADKKGKMPSWLAKLSNLVFAAAWFSYDHMFKKLFGDGERTQKVDEEQADGGFRWQIQRKCLIALDADEKTSLVSTG